MRVRILFTKEDSLRFVGHLDLMRFFQKAVRRSGLPAAYSRGYHPHLLIGFAAPLGIGLVGEGEIMDLELACKDPFPLNAQEMERLQTIGLDNDRLPLAPSSAEICARLNAVLPPQIRILRAVRMPNLAPKAMAALQSADYRMEVRDIGCEDNLSIKLMQFLAKDVILIRKDEKEKNIRPLIYEAELSGTARGFVLRGRIAQGSSNNLRPEHFLDAFAADAGFSVNDADIRMIRGTLYGKEERPLIDEGEEIDA